MGAAGSGAAGSVFMGASAGAGSGFMGVLAGAGSGAAGSLLMGASAGAGSGASAGASMPSFLIRLRRWLSRCTQAVALFTSSSSSSVFVLRRAGGPVSFRGCEGGRGASQLWSWVCSSSVFVLRRAGGPVSFRGCEGGSSSVFVLRRAGGPVSFRGCEGEWRRVSFGVVFCGEWRRVSFGVVLSCSAGNGGESASGAVKGE